MSLSVEEDTMRNPSRFAAIGLLIWGLGLINMTIASSEVNWVPLTPATEGTPPEVTVLESNENHTLLRLDIPGYYVQEIESDGITYQIPYMPTAGFFAEEQCPELPVVTHWVAIPNTGSVELDVIANQTRNIPGSKVYPLQDIDEEYYPDTDIQFNQAVYARDDLYPTELVHISEPMIMRDVRVVAVSWIPIRTNPSRGGLTISTSIEIDLRNTDTPGVNEKTQQFSRMTPSFYNTYKSNIVNFDNIDELIDGGDLTPGSLLIICPNNSLVTSRLAPLVEWKTRKGYTVTLATTAQTGATFSLIKSYIQTAYNTWDPPLEYVVLAGDAEGSYTIPVYDIQYDHGYTRLDGADLISDVAIGRLSFDNTTQLSNIVNKIVKYESEPYVTSTSWYSRAYLLAGTNHAYSTVVTSRYIKQQMRDAGITNVTIREYDTYSIPAYDLQTNINAGVSYMNYRGSWVGEMDCVDFQGSLTNGFMLPLAVVITCGTGTFTSSYEAVSECWLREGSALTPAGAVACIGTATTGTHTRFNNIMNTGIFYGLFVKKLYNYGNALVEGKIQFLRAFPFDIYSQERFSYWNNLMGDPSVEAWTRAPRTMNVSTAPQVIVGQNYLTVEVENATGTPISDALVCLWKEGETFHTEYTDDTGILNIPISINTTGTLKVTVTKHDHYPYLDDLNVVSGDIVTPVDWDIDDDNTGYSSGNNDGIANPGETIELSLQLKNWGDSTAINVTGLMTEDDDYLTITQNSSDYGSITSGSTTWSTTDYIIQISDVCPNDHLLNLLIDVTDSLHPTYTSMVPIIISAADLEFNNRTLTGGGDTFNPGETRQIIVTLDNIGGFDATGIVGKLYSSHYLAQVTDSIGAFGTIQGLNSADNDLDRFTVSMSHLIYPGQPVTFTIALNGNGSFSDTVTFEEIVGSSYSNDPTGPDEYGYWAFENIDTDYSKHPTYSWVDISSVGTEIILPDYNEDQDTSKIVSLPFHFNYYGEVFSRITVCSNGWIAMGDQEEMNNFRNYPIPGAHGPWGMIAALWDDLVLSNGHIYYYNDVINHRFIVEWNNLRTRTGNYPETIQIVLYDPQFYPTPTGDGEILIQYQVVNNVVSASDDIPYSTVGIESHNQLDGIQYTYWNTYPSSAAGLTNGRAILFTTDEGIQGAAVDTIGPEIAHTPLMDTFNTVGPYAVEADIWDISTVDYTDLYYSTNGDPFTVIGMITTIGSDWKANIPGQSPGTTIDYFIYSVDDSGNYAQTDTFSFDIWDVIYLEKFESGAPGWTHYSAGGGWQDQWHLSTEDAYSPIFSYKCGDNGTGNYADSMDAYLVSPQFTLPANAELYFMHRIESDISTSYPDSAYDGGLMEISLDGNPWEQLYPSSGYTRSIRYLSGTSTPYTGPFEGGTHVWAGTIAWTRVEVDLSGHPGSTCRIRFRFGSDQDNNREGWYIDDFAVVGLPEGTLSPPQNLELIRLGNNIYLIWSSVFGATYYTIYRTTDLQTATWDSLDTVYEPTHSFHDGNLLGYSSCFYRVVAGN